MVIENIQSILRNIEPKMIINISSNDWNPKDLVRSAVEDYIRFIHYVTAQSVCASPDCKAIADKIHDLKKLLDKFDRYDEYEKAFGNEWDRTFDYRSLLAQSITRIERELSCAELDDKQRATQSLILEMHLRDICQSEEDEAKYGHPLVDKAKQRLSLINESFLNQPIRMYDMIMPVEVEEDELDLIIESVSFVFAPYDMFQWKSNIAQLHECAKEWFSSNAWKDGNDLGLLEGTLEEYISIKASKS